jgi:D-alanyl-D-alanine carboxypeptidase
LRCRREFLGLLNLQTLAAELLSNVQPTKELNVAKRIISVALLFSLPALASPGLAQRANRDRTLDARIDRLIKPEAAAERFSGIVLVARGNQIVVQRPYGFADWERQVPNAMTTRFNVGSITKLMTETLVDVLAGEARLDLSAPVARYLVGFPDGPKGGHATVQDLVNHKAGVPHRVTTELEEVQHFSPADIVERVKARGLLFEPGSAELYSSAGYTSLARVTEIVENKPFDSILAERVFRPASMSSATDETGQELMPRRALPYKLERGPVNVAVASAPYKDLSFLAGAGSVFATADDILHLVRALNDGKFGGVAENLLGTRGDTTWTGWYGRINGYEGSVDYLPSADITIVLLSNLQSGANWQIRERVRSIVLGQPISAIAAVPPVASAFENPADFVGLYGDPSDPTAVEEKDGHFFNDGDEFYPISGHQYYETVSADVMHFVRDSSGKVIAKVKRFGTSERSSPRIGRSPAVSSAQINGESALSSASAPVADTTLDQVRRAALDYLEGFYEGDTAKLIRSVRPNVAKSGFWRPRDSTAFEPDSMSYGEFLSYARNVRARNRPVDPRWPKDVVVFDVQSRTASAG